MQAHCLTRETFRSFFEETCQAHGAHCTSSICAINVTSGYVSRLNAECPLCLCMQHVYSTHVRKGSAQNHSLHMYSMHGDPTVVYSTCSPFSFVTCLLNIGGVILNLMYKKVPYLMY